MISKNYFFNEPSGTWISVHQTYHFWRRKRCIWVHPSLKPRKLCTKLLSLSQLLREKPVHGSNKPVHAKLAILITLEFIFEITWDFSFFLNKQRQLDTARRSGSFIQDLLSRCNLSISVLQYLLDVHDLCFSSACLDSFVRLFLCFVLILPQLSTISGDLFPSLAHRRDEEEKRQFPADVSHWHQRRPAASKASALLFTKINGGWNIIIEGDGTRWVEKTMGGLKDSDLRCCPRGLK